MELHPSRQPVQVIEDGRRECVQETVAKPVGVSIDILLTTVENGYGQIKKATWLDYARLTNHESTAHQCRFCRRVSNSLCGTPDYIFNQMNHPKRAYPTDNHLYASPS